MPSFDDAVAATPRDRTKLAAAKFEIIAAAACSPLSAGAALLLALIAARYVNAKTRYAYPSIGRLSTDLGKTRNSVRRMIHELERGGWIVVERTHGGRGQTNRMALIFDGDRETLPNARRVSEPETPSEMDPFREQKGSVCDRETLPKTDPNTVIDTVRDIGAADIADDTPPSVASSSDGETAPPPSPMTVLDTAREAADAPATPGGSAGDPLAPSDLVRRWRERANTIGPAFSTMHAADAFYEIAMPDVEVLTPEMASAFWVWLDRAQSRARVVLGSQSD